MTIEDGNCMTCERCNTQERCRNTRAAQVEAMRCKTCAKRITSKPLYPGSGSFLVEHCPWQDCGGCFNHESKEGE